MRELDRRQGWIDRGGRKTKAKEEAADGSLRLMASAPSKGPNLPFGVFCVRVLTHLLRRQGH